MGVCNLDVEEVQRDNNEEGQDTTRRLGNTWDYLLFLEK